MWFPLHRVESSLVISFIVNVFLLNCVFFDLFCVPNIVWNFLRLHGTDTSISIYLAIYLWKQLRKSNVVAIGPALTTNQHVLFCCLLTGCDLNYVCLRLKIDLKPQEVSKSLSFSRLHTAPFFTSQYPPAFNIRQEARSWRSGKVSFVARVSNRLKNAFTYLEMVIFFKLKPLVVEFEI